MTVIPQALRAIRVHGFDDARTAAEAAQALDRPPPARLTLLAGGYGGALWLLGLVARLSRDYPQLAVTGLLDCGDRAGEAQGALAAGVPCVLFTGPAAAAARLADIASLRGARLLTDPPPVLDLRGSRDPLAACRAWLTECPY